MQEVGVRSSHSLPLQISPVSHQNGPISLAAAANTVNLSGTNNTGSSLSSVRAGSRGSSRNSSLGESDETQATANNSNEDHCSPMDLSSTTTSSSNEKTLNQDPAAGFVNGSFSLEQHGRGEATTTLDSQQRFFELAKAQHLAQQLQREENETTPPSASSEGLGSRIIPKKRQWPQLGDELGASLSKHLQASAKHDSDHLEPELKRRHEDGAVKSVVPLELVKEKWSSRERSSSEDEHTPGPNGIEVRKRRLDALLNKKFSASVSPPTSPNVNCSENGPESPSSSSTSTATPITSRRSSNERKANRRKQAMPNSANVAHQPYRSPSTEPPKESPVPTLSVKPNSELYPMLPPLPLPLPSSSPKERPASSGPSAETELEQNALKGQILQLQLAQAALLSSSASTDFLKSIMFNPVAAQAASSAPGTATANNPLLYYGYYAQMLQGLQAQQHKLVEELVSKQQQNKIKMEEEEEQNITVDDSKPNVNDIVRNFLKRDRSSAKNNNMNNEPNQFRNSNNNNKKRPANGLSSSSGRVNGKGTGLGNYSGGEKRPRSNEVSSFFKRFCRILQNMKAQVNIETYLEFCT